MAKRIFKTHTLEYYQGGSFHKMTVPRSHYDLAVAYLRRGNIHGSIADVDEVIINFPEDELREILAHPDEEVWEVLQRLERDRADRVKGE
jgi:hypothetical protein